MPKLCIDPGHGGSDSGGAGLGNIEKEETLDIALVMTHMCMERGIECLLTRNRDVFVSITQRWQMANAWGADLFLSIHTNAAGGRGIEVLYGKPKYAPLAKRLATYIHDVTGWPLRRDEGGYYRPTGVGVIKNTTMPALLSESGFIDFPPENAAMDTPEYTQAIARAHTDFACEYFGLDQGEEEDMAARVSSPVSREHHFPDVWLDRYDTYWLHLQNRGKEEAHVTVVACQRKEDGGSYFTVKELDLAPDGQKNTYDAFDLAAAINGAAGTLYDSVNVSVHSTQPITCVLREE